MIAALAFLIGLAGGAAATVAWSRRRPRLRHKPGPANRRSGTSGPGVSIDHVIELARRAVQASAMCLVGRELDSVITRGDIGFDNRPIDKAVALARLAMADGRQHVMREDRCTVAVGDEGLAVAAILPAGDPPDEALAVVTSDLRKLLGELQADMRSKGDAGARSADEGALPTRLDTLPAIAAALCDRARYVTGRSTAVVLRNPDSEVAAVIAVSTNADRRLKGITVSAESAAGRACLVDGTITAAAGAPAGDGKGLRRIDPSKEKGLKSPGDEKEVVLTIENRRKSAITTYWIDYDGDRVRYQDVAAGEDAEQITFEGHYWVMVDGDGKALGIYVALDKDGVILIR